MDKRPIISISIPVLNEAGNLPLLYVRLAALADRMEPRCDFEFVFTDNHSEDQTWSLLGQLANRDPRVRALRFSRNFGFQRSILANYIQTRGDAVMQIDADLQDPPELLEEFFELWKQGYYVVYGIRRKRPEGFFLTRVRKIGYWIIDKLSEYPIPRDAGDFRLVDRRVINALQRYRTATPYLRGQIAALGFRQVGVPYDRRPRLTGESKFHLRSLFTLGLAGVLNHSVVPLRIATYAGALLVAVSLIGAAYYFWLRLSHPELPQGLASIHILVLFGIGFQALLMGIIGEYLLRIFVLLRREPIAVVEDVLNVDFAEIKF
jgi:polyisoprenyl-phosphate glycosyltransferase